MPHHAIHALVAEWKTCQYILVSWMSLRMRGDAEKDASEVILVWPAMRWLGLGLIDASETIFVRRRGDELANVHLG